MRLRDVFFAVFLLLFLAVPTYFTQPLTTLSCGENITNRFIGDEVEHLYQIEVETGINLILHADPLPLGSEGGISFEVFLPNGSLVDALTYVEHLTFTLETGELATSGAYDIFVANEGIRDYQLFVSCVTEDGTVISDNNLVQAMVCGEQIDNPVSRINEVQQYYVALNAGDSMIVSAESLDGDFSDLRIEAGLYSPNNAELDRISEDFKATLRAFETGPVPTTGIYRLYIRTYDNSNGVVRVALDCVLADGGVIRSSRETRRELDATLLTPLAIDSQVQAPPATPSNDSVQPPLTNMPPTEFMLLPSTLDRTVSIPIDIGGVTRTGVLTQDFEGLFAFTFDAEIFNLVELNVARTSGNLNVGIVVLDENDTVIYLAHLFTGQTLSAQIEIPASGAYTIGFYPLQIQTADAPQTTVVTAYITD